MLKRLAINDIVCFAVHKSSNFNCNLVTSIGKLCEACLV